MYHAFMQNYYIKKIKNKKIKPARAVKKRVCACAGRLTTSCAWSVFSCAGKKLQNNRGTSLGASQFFFKLLLALLFSHTGARTNASADRFQYLIRAGVGSGPLGLACESTLPVCFSQYAVWGTGCLFGKFVQVSCRSGCL